MIEILFSGYFWGAVLILVGGAAIINAVFKLGLPVTKVAFWTLLVLIVFSVVISTLLGTFGSDHNVSMNVFGGSQKLIPDQTESHAFFNIFGASTIDLTQAEPAEDGTKIRVGTLFGSTKILVNSRANYKVKAFVLFGSSKVPDQKNGIFGNDIMISARYKPQMRAFNIHLNTIFGSTQVIHK